MATGNIRRETLRNCISMTSYGAHSTQRALREKTTISELVRQAIRERYIGSREQRLSVMRSFVGICKPRAGDTNAGEEVRRLRKGSRIDRLADR